MALLIISKEKNGKASHHINRYHQRLLLQFCCDSIPGELIHRGPTIELITTAFAGRRRSSKTGCARQERMLASHVHKGLPYALYIARFHVLSARGNYPYPMTCGPGHDLVRFIPRKWVRHTQSSNARTSSHESQTSETAERLVKHDTEDYPLTSAGEISAECGVRFHSNADGAWKADCEWKYKIKFVLPFAVDGKHLTRLWSHAYISHVSLANRFLMKLEL
jgi:hypothetical protein